MGIGSVIGQMDLNEFPYSHYVPDIILKHIVGWNDVRADGNCGFRCVADLFHGGQGNWRYVRRALSNEIGAHPVYQQMYYDGVDAIRQRINWGGDSCGEDHHLEITNDWFLIANFYKCAVMSFGQLGGGCSLLQYITVLPRCAESTLTQLVAELAIAHLGSFMHFIRFVC